MLCQCFWSRTSQRLRAINSPEYFILGSYFCILALLTTKRCTLEKKNKEGNFIHFQTLVSTGANKKNVSPLPSEQTLYQFFCLSGQQSLMFSLFSKGLKKFLLFMVNINCYLKIKIFIYFFLLQKKNHTKRIWLHKDNKWLNLLRSLKANLEKNLCSSKIQHRKGGWVQMQPLSFLKFENTVDQWF